MSVVESGRIVGSIARDGHHFSSFLQQIDEPLLVGGSRPGHHPQHFHPLIGLFVGEKSEVGPGDLCLLGSGFVPNANLSGYLYGRGSSVSGHHLHLDAGIDTLFYGRRNIASDGVADSGDGL